MSEQRSGPDFDPELDKHEGSIPAMNRSRGGKADADAEPAPGNVEWEVPANENPQTLEGAVRTGEKDQNGDVAKLPGKI